MATTDIPASNHIRQAFESIVATIDQLNYTKELPQGHIDIDTIATDWTQSDDDELFENMAACIFAGGMKITVLEQKWMSIREAFKQFKIDDVAVLDVDTLLENNMIIRHPGKVKALIANATKIKCIQEENESFVNYLRDNLEHGLEYLLKRIVADFAFLGPATGADFLKDIGMGGFKPDIHVQRILRRLGIWSGIGTELSDIFGKIRNETGLSFPEIDRLLFRYGSGHKLYHPICALTPICGMCYVRQCPERRGPRLHLQLHISKSR
ncbi:DNA-3-methyladenine glycosylase I [bacterium AH-315-J21]|nr:DNA-3-methyladenine glycosylase I [bacterium AH-315-J21]